MFSKGLWFSVISVVALALGFSDTAAAQLTATPGSFTFNVSSGSSQTTQIQITSTSSTTITAGTTASWLGISPAGPINITPGNPVTYTVTASAVGFADGQTLTGQFTVNGAAAPLNVSVTMNVGGGTSGTLSSNPANLSFTGSVGGPTPQTQTVTINNNTATAVTFNATASSVNNWLSISSSQGTTGTASATLTVSVNQSLTGLTAGNYDGQINITSTAGNFAIPVKLTVSGAPTLTVSPTGALNFFYQFGGGQNPPFQQLTLTSSAGSIPFSVSSTASSPSTWLVVSPLGSSATGSNGTSNITVSINTQNLSPGNYTGTITITSQVAANIVIPVNLQVSTNPLLQLSTSAMTFTGAAGTTNAFSQQVTVTSSGSALAFTANANSGAAPTTWLSVTPTSGTTGTGTGTLTIKADPTNLPAGTYTGTVTLSSGGAANSPTIQVTLNLSNSLLITAAPPALIFNFQTNQGAPPAQTIALTSNGAPQTYTVAATTSNCGNWLNAVAQNLQTPGNITVSVNTSVGFTAGIPCQGTITVTPSGTGLNPLTIPVTLNVSNNALLNVSPTYVTLSVQSGQDPSTLPNISLTSTDPIAPISYSTAVGPGASWLFVGPGSITPSLLAYQISSRFLSPGTYTGTIVITPTAAGALPVTVTISLTVLSASSISASPSNLTFTQAQGAAAPATQTIHLTSTGAGGILNYSFSASTSSGATNWLSVASPTGQATGATPGDIVVTANGTGLGQGSYDGIITVVAPGANNTPIQIPVKLNVTQAQSISLSSSTLSFTYQVGGGTTAPPDQTLTITSSGGPATFTVTKAVQQPTGGNWLSVSPVSGTTAANGANFTAPITVSINPSALAAGTYIGTISVGSPVSPQPQVVTVTLTVLAVPIPAITQVLNAGSLQPGPIAPGEILTIKGAGLGPATPVNYTLNASGGLDPRLGGVRVLFDGFPGSPYYVSATQINVIAPYEIAGRISTNVTVEYNGQTSGGQTYQVSPTSPGIFTLNSSGSGPGAIINADGTINGPAGFTSAYPTFGALRGSTVAVFATGYGQSNPPSTTGCFSPLNQLRLSVFPVTVTIGGLIIANPEVSFAGAAPGGPCGFMQINVKIPDNAPLGQNFITFSANGVSSPSTATITVR